MKLLAARIEQAGVRLLPGLLAGLVLTAPPTRLLRAVEPDVWAGASAGQAAYRAPAYPPLA